MMLTLHVVIALASLISASVAVVQSRPGLLRFNYTLIALTALSGVVLAFDGAHMLQLCMSGLSYLAVVSLLLVVARYRLKQRASE